MDIRLAILNGRLTMPNVPTLRKKCNRSQYEAIERMFESLWNNYLLKGPGAVISTPYWMEQIGSVTLTNLALKILSVNGWVTSKSLPNNNWGEAYLNEKRLLEYVSTEELAGVRLHNKFNMYTLSNEPSDVANITQINGKRVYTDIYNYGFMKTGNTQYQFDTDTMFAHKDDVVTLVNKGIDKMIAKYPQILGDLANYKEVGEQVVNNYTLNPQTYCGGERSSDPRHRNNRGDLSKIGNPIGFKIMRSLLVIPEQYRNKATARGLENMFLFIAELRSFKSGTKQQKIDFGRHNYLTTSYNNESCIDDLFEDIWLDRVYQDIDNALGNSYKLRIAKQRVSRGESIDLDLTSMLVDYKWTVPTEIDMSASVLGYIGLLLNHAPFMKRCNMIGDQLQDAWAHDTITNRKQFKTIMRQCYGSQLSPNQMWDEMGIPYTHEEVVAFTKELHTGELAVANAFKDFIIKSCDPKPQMTVNVRGREIDISCNKFFNRGETTAKYDLYDTYTNRVRTIHHTKTIRIPDLKSFRRWFVTGLIHGLDGNVMNTTCNLLMDKYSWAIDIHDAIICCPEAASDARRFYARELTDIHTNREQILTDYFNSIGISAAGIKLWQDTVLPLVEPYEGEFKCNHMVLK